VLGQTAASDPHVGAHARHVGATAMHAARDFTCCRTKSSTALTPGHIDGTGGIVQAEVVFSSLDPSSSFSVAATTCAIRTAPGCRRATRGDHRKPCATCHTSVVDGNNAIINAALHVNGAENVQFTAAGSSYNPANKSCSGAGNVVTARAHGPVGSWRKTEAVTRCSWGRTLLTPRCTSSANNRSRVCGEFSRRGSADFDAMSYIAPCSTSSDKKLRPPLRNHWFD